ncbi:MAG: hypothetical protein KJ607_05320 [Bacteroidetes bacterium]|nr:hypothetical protein [Bacteroidota bacterium]
MIRFEYSGWTDVEKLKIIRIAKLRGIVPSCKKYGIKVSTFLEWKKELLKNEKAAQNNDDNTKTLTKSYAGAPGSDKITKKKSPSDKKKITKSKKKKKLIPLSKMEPLKTLELFYIRNGCMREPDLDARSALKSNYKKGYEVRFTAMNDKELEIIRNAIVSLGLNPATPFIKRGKYIQPVYGIELAFRLRKLRKVGKIGNPPS